MLKVFIFYPLIIIGLSSNIRFYGTVTGAVSLRSDYCFMIIFATGMHRGKWVGLLQKIINFVLIEKGCILIFLQISKAKGEKISMATFDAAAFYKRLEVSHIYSQMVALVSEIVVKVCICVQSPIKEIRSRNAA